MAGSNRGGRHRLGAPGLVHCTAHREVADALEEFRRTWFTAILVPAKHSIAGLRKRAARAATDRAWAPATAAQAMP